ncbi:MAG: asparagine synthase C-terminal domain-containing protein, partial [Candidatus Methanomethyliaceae archaeon]
MNYESILLELLTKSIKSSKANAVLFSGGIDSSLITIIASKIRPIVAITAIFNNGNDEEYSLRISKKLKIPHIIVKYNIEEALEASKEIIKILKTFDHIEIRNDITIYIALKKCKEEGIEEIMTGDGGDELFAGYDFMINMKKQELERYMDLLYKNWNFSSPIIGNVMGLNVYQPFLMEEIIEFAKKLPYEWKINGLYGKWILRKILEKMGFSEIAWRKKEPIEIGSGSSIITKIFLNMLGEEANKIEEEALKDGIRFWNREQIFFYKLFREIYGTPPRAKNGCPYCKSPIIQQRCKYCGYCWRPH